MSLSTYLTSKYLNAEPPTSSSKKRKRKDKSSSSSKAGLTIADDDALGWHTTTSASARANNDDDGDDDGTNAVRIATSSAEFRRSKKSAWRTIGGVAAAGDGDGDGEVDAEARAADAIVASAAAENRAAAHLDEQPVVEGGDGVMELDEEGADEGVVKMGDGTHAGLQSAAAVTAQMEKAKRAERRRWEAEEKAMGRRGEGRGKGRGAEETVYRDATGRRIDISMRRAEARAEADAQVRKEREEKEARLGDVQVAAKAKRREELEEARFIPLARGVDDEEMNRELRDRERWDDPAMQFLERKERITGGGGSFGMGGNVGKPVYNGAAAPNRYGIRPGHRWDGVDRGNGFEGERFRELNRSKRNKELDFAWQTDA